MTFTLPTQNERAAATKPISGLSGINNSTVQFSFKEIPGTLKAGNAGYQLLINDFANGDWLQIELDDNGTLTVIVGPQPNGWMQYTGGWTLNGGSHVVHATIDSFGLPTVWIDGVMMTFLFSSPGAGAPPTPINTLFFQMFDLDGGGTLKSGILNRLFMTQGVLGPGTIFCCP